jgi:NAD(P)-dependent dehydrogenase (short-subunit alcohol dehydrogenase family)
VLDASPPTPAAHGGLGPHLVEQLTAFGTDWLYLAGLLVPMLAAAVWLAARAGGTGGPLARLADGAARVTGLPGWSAVTLVVLDGALVFAVVGFFWDVAWHIDIGRDEFLLSPPHVSLLLGLAGIGLAGAAGIVTATRDRADAGWRVGRWRLPPGPTAMAFAGAAALVGFGVDELWHAAYGLDVTMWSPPHLTMISAAAFIGVAGWLTYAEAGPGRARPAARRHLVGFLAGVLLIALSAWQLEYDLGVPQWQHLAQPVLVALGGGFALTACRAALGRGGALVAVAHFVVVRLLLLGLTAGVWGLSQPRFPLYLASAVAVEVAFAAARDRAPAIRALLAGLGVGTIGIAGEWLVGLVWFHHPWQPRLLPWLPLVVAVAVAAGVLGGAFGQVVSYRTSGIRAGAAGAAGLVLLLGVAATLPRAVPDATATLAAEPAGEGHVHVEVAVTPTDAVVGADRWEVMAWQGDGRVLAPLEPTRSGTWRTATPVPVDGDWKANVLLSRGAAVGGVPVRLPEDPEIGAAAIEVPMDGRSAAFVGIESLLLREAHDGPAWPGLVAYAFVTSAIAILLGLLVAGTVALDRRRRARGWRGGHDGSLEGVRIVLTGAAGGIGRAARTALEAQGARVVGIDLASDRPDTLVADVADAAAVRHAVDTAVGRLGGLDVVVANAGVGLAGDSTAFPDPATRRLVEVNLLGAWNTVAAATRHLADGGRVVGVTSGLARATVPYAAAYTASKRGLAGYLDVLRSECAGRWTVTEVRPAYIATAIHAQPEAAGASLDGVTRRERVTDAAAAIVAACETRRRAIASSPLTAAELWLAHHLPAVVDRVVARRARRRWREHGRPVFAAAAVPARPAAGAAHAAPAGDEVVGRTTPGEERR